MLACPLAAFNPHSYMASRKERIMANRKCPTYLKYGFCSGCYLHLTQGALPCGYRPPKPSKWRLYEMALSRRFAGKVAANDKPGTPAASEDTTTLKGFPLVQAFLTETQWEEDKKGRKPGKLSIFAQQGNWVCCLNDNDAEASLYATKTSVKSALESLERHLANGDGEWRPWRVNGKK